MRLCCAVFIGVHSWLKPAFHTRCGLWPSSALASPAPLRYNIARLMRYPKIDPRLFTTNRDRLKRLMLPNSLAVVNANDVPPTNADGSLLPRANSDLFYITGVEQEQSLLLLYPDAHDE